MLMRSSTGVRTVRMSPCLYTTLTLAVVGSCSLATVLSAHLTNQTGLGDGVYPDPADGIGVLKDTFELINP